MIPIRISDLGRIITGATPPTKEPYLFGSEVSFLTPSDMTFDRRHVQTKRGISSAGAARFGTRLLPPNAVAVVCIGSIGKVCMTDGPVLTNQQVNSIVVDESRHSPDFVYYLMRTMHHRLKTVAGGAATPIVNKSSFTLLEVTVPDRRTQFRIGAYLKSFDDLIEVNRQRLEILEGMARLLYREWFVHFRYPGHEDVELVASDLGPIPAAWTITTLGEAATWLSGGTPNTKELAYWSGDIPWITSGSLTSFLLDDSDRKLTQLGVDNGSRIVERNTTVFVVRGMSLAKEFRHGIADVPLAFGQDCKALIAKPGIEPLFLALSVSSLADEIQGMVEFAAHGTGKLSTDRIQALAIPHPTETIQQLFVRSVEPMRKLMSNLRRQNRALREARDLLLPRLVSGELDVSELDLQLEAVGP